MDLPSELAFPRLLTVGHSNHQPDAFLKLLQRFKVKELVDVRSIPSSGKFPHFKKNALQKILETQGISYRHCPELGNKGVEGGILGLLQLPEGKAAVCQLAKTAEEATLLGPKCAFMCAEADWRECHRQVVAQRLMLDFGVTVQHIKRDGTLEAHPSDHELPDYFQGPGPGPASVPKAGLHGYHGVFSAMPGPALQEDLDGRLPALEAAPEEEKSDKVVKPRRWGRAKKEGVEPMVSPPVAEKPDVPESVGTAFQ